MGKRGKAARKRRRDNEVVNTTAAALLASELASTSADDAAEDDCRRSDDPSNPDDDGEKKSAMMAETTSAAQHHCHGIPDAALDATVATLHRLCGLVDVTTGKLALRDKRYRSLRRVVYELQNGVVAGGGGGGGGGGGVVHNASIGGLPRWRSGTDAGGGGTASASAGFERGDPRTPPPPPPASSSKITREISAQIENGAWALAVTTLRNARRRQEEHTAMMMMRGGNEATARKGAAAYLRPKLGAVQRWVRQLDAAGTDDSLALGVLDAILRVVSPETILPVRGVDIDNATWARLGVDNNSSSPDGGDGKRHDDDDDECGGRVRLFPPLDLRERGDPGGSAPAEDTSSRVERDTIVDSLVSCMRLGEDGIRRITTTSPPEARAHPNALFRRCGFEKGAERAPPNKYDLEIVTTTAPIIVETGSLGSCHLSISLDATLSGHHILLENCTSPPIAKTPLPYVQDSFLLENVLSPTECDRLIASAESAVYHPDEPLGGQPGASILAHACVWIVDHKLERTIFERVKRFLPSYEQSRQDQCSGDAVETLMPLGLNRRFRFYRYVPGRYYRPHIDGAWPPSGFDGEGNYRYDICDETNKNGLQFVSSVTGACEKHDDATSKELSATTCEKACGGATGNRRRQLSRLTFLIYLNDDFDGGHTTFLIPAAEEEGVLNAFPVNPVRGGVLVFPHGTCAAPLHEGSPVLSRCKYVVRTEVEYLV